LVHPAGGVNVKRSNVSFWARTSDGLITITKKRAKINDTSFLFITERFAG
jgi:hypothetical protein